MEKTLTHPILGTITLEAHNEAWWTTEPLPIAGLGLSGRISTHSPGAPPADKALEEMVKALSIMPKMRREMLKRMITVYEEETDFYGEGIPKLRTPEDIWPRFSELTVFVGPSLYAAHQDEIETTYSFRLAADPDHEISVECRRGKIVDVLCEG